MRDIEALKRKATGHGPSVGPYATALLGSPLPWIRIRQVYRLPAWPRSGDPSASRRPVPGRWRRRRWTWA